MSYLYFILLIGSFSMPFVYSFEPRMKFIKHWKSVFLSIAIVALLFLLWDVYFTAKGYWGFNPAYFMGLLIFKLPIEEWLFFFLIPYASIFIHYSFIYFLPNIQLSKKRYQTISILLIGFVTVLLFFNIDKSYTFVNSLFLIVVLVLGLTDKYQSFKYFFITYFIILIPFVMVNGVLTGSFIKEPIVWYNNVENLGIRFFTIPIEDFGYTFSLMFLNIWLIERFKTKFS